MSEQSLCIDRMKTEYSDKLPLVGASSSLDDVLDAMSVAESTEALIHGGWGRFLGLVIANTAIRAVGKTSSKNPGDTPDAPVGHDAEAPTEDAGSEDADSEGESQASGSSSTVEAEAPEADAALGNSGESVWSRQGERSVD